MLFYKKNNKQNGVINLLKSKNYPYCYFITIACNTIIRLYFIIVLFVSGECKCLTLHRKELYMPILCRLPTVYEWEYTFSVYFIWMERRSIALQLAKNVERIEFYCLFVYKLQHSVIKVTRLEKDRTLLFYCIHHIHTKVYSWWFLHLFSILLLSSWLFLTSTPLFMYQWIY